MGRSSQGYELSHRLACSGAIGQPRCNAITNSRLFLICNMDGFRDTPARAGVNSDPDNTAEADDRLGAFCNAGTKHMPHHHMHAIGTAQRERRRL